jgi:hypothetical protein
MEGQIWKFGDLEIWKWEADLKIEEIEDRYSMLMLKMECWVLYKSTSPSPIGERERERQRKGEGE